jgi:NHLM bacteriocin system ABC transporter peptidase/ATP-binding protein
MAAAAHKPVKNGVAKTPVILQMEALECGAACLAMVAAYYGLWLPLERVRTDCGVSRDGSRARNVIKAARQYGLEAQGWRYEPESLRDEGQFPCIIHWNFNHFVVLNGFKGKYALLNDPGSGPKKVTMEEFDKAFTGIALLLTPGESFEPGGKRRSVLAFARERLKGTTALFVFVMATTLLSAVIGVIQPAFARVFMDVLLPGNNPGWLLPFTLIMSLVTAISLGVGFVRARQTLKIEGKLAVVANSGFMWHVLRLPLDFFAQRSVGDLVQRKEANTSIASMMINTLAPLVLDAALIVIYLTVMLRYSVLLTLVGVGSIFINMAVAALVSKKRVEITRRRMRDYAKMRSAETAGISMIETLKSSGAEDGYFARWAGYQATVSVRFLESARLGRTLGAIPTLVNTLTNSAVLLLGASLIMNGQFTVGSLLAFQGFLASFTGPAGSFIGAGQSVTELRAQMERIEDVLRYEPDVSDEEFHGEPMSDKLSGGVELRDVTFGYSRLEPPLLDKLNLSIKPGERVAIVGSSGCGKSTISKLITGLYQPWSGDILYDGKSRSEIPPEVFHASLAAVDQDIILFADTIRNNITMWDSSIKDFEVILAARDAQIHNDILRRDGGYNYRMAEGGRDFSGGQRQKLEIARVLATDPRLIILDEATSALDAKTERDTVEAINNRGVTTLVVAHRLSTVRDCDRIYVLDKGKIVEQGTHEELFALNGFYTKLVVSD